MLSYALLSAAIFIASASAQGVPQPIAPATYVNSHNAARSNWNANPLSAITDAAFLQSTQDWANACVFEHSEPNGAYGENLYAAGSTSSSPTSNFQRAMDAWVGEDAAYCASLRGETLRDANGNPLPTGHFTQVVWKATSEVACAVATCPPNTIFPPNNNGQEFYATYYVCRYRSAGNFSGQYAQQVDGASCPAVSAPANPSAARRRSMPKREFTLQADNLFACGPAEVDCSSIADAGEVTCQDGQCVVESCLAGSVSSDGASCI